MQVDRHKRMNGREEDPFAHVQAGALSVDARSHWCFKKEVFVQVDWDKWVDEDEQDEADPKKDFDMSDLQNFSNFGGGDFGAGLGGGMSGIGNVEVRTAHPSMHDVVNCMSCNCLPYADH